MTARIPHPAPGRPRRLPPILVLALAAEIGEETAGTLCPGALGRGRLARTLDAHAREILPRLIGNGAEDEDRVFRGRVTVRVSSGDLVCDLAYDLKNAGLGHTGGHWSLGCFPSGRGILHLARYIWGEADSLDEDEAARRILARLGLAALRSLPGTAVVDPRR